MPDRYRDVAELTERLLHAVRQVTPEEFRNQDAHFERDSRLGRELLFLIANNEWCRRTTEVVDIQQVQAVDTEIVVDLDLSYVDHEAFQPEAGVVWLPVLAVPAPRASRTHAAAPHDEPGPEGAEPIFAVEVSDAAGARVPKMTQAQVHHRLAAALAEIVLNVMATRLQQPDGGSGGEVDREQKLVLSAAIRRLLPGDPPEGEGRRRAVPAGVRRARAQLDAVLSRDLATARDLESAGSVPGTDTDERTYAEGLHPDRPRPVLGAQVGEILDALIGTFFVVIAVERAGTPVSYRVSLPSRRLVRRGISGFLRLQPRVRLDIDLLAPTTHADRLIELELPPGIALLEHGRLGGRPVARGRRHSSKHPKHPGPSAGQPLAEIDVVLPGPLDRVETLLGRLLAPTLDSERTASWVDARIAEMTLHKVDSALDCLGHYEVTAVRRVAVAQRGHAPAELTDDVARQLRSLRGVLLRIRDSAEPDGGEPVRIAELRENWDGGSWFPVGMRRRLAVNTASPEAVLIRAPAVEDVAQRARPTRAQIAAEVAVLDSPVFNVARYAGTMNLLLLTAVAVLIAVVLAVQGRHGIETLHRELLATVLTLFSAVQASRVEHPDGATLRGLLARASYALMIASMMPTLLLAVALAAVPPGYLLFSSLIALACQVVVVLRLRRGPLSGSLERAAPLSLSTEAGPDHARSDGLRNARSRALTAEALRLGREAHAFVVSRPAGEGQFLDLLDGSQHVAGDGAGAANLLGVVQSATAGRTMSYLVFRDRPAQEWTAGGAAPGDGTVEPVPVDADRLAPMEPAEWVLEVVVGVPLARPGTLADHPVMAVLAATARSNYRVLTAQYPGPPPTRRPDAAARRWMRLRIGVSYRRGDSLRGLGSFLYRVHRLDGASFGGGTIVVDVRVGPERGSAAAATAVLTDRDFDVVPDDEAAGDPAPRWRALALCGHGRAGLVHDMLSRLALERPGLELAGMTAALLHGQAVVFVLARDSGTFDPDGLRERLPHGLRGGDRLTVALDEWKPAGFLDGEAVEERLLLRVGIRTPDRRGALREMLFHIQQALARHAPEVQVAELDVWFAMVHVVSGRSSRGRLTIRLPGGHAAFPGWLAVDWGAVEREVSRAAAVAGLTDPAGSSSPSWAFVSPQLDDTVVTLDLMRAVPAPSPAPVSPPAAALLSPARSGALHQP